MSGDVKQAANACISTHADAFADLRDDDHEQDKEEL